MFSSRSQATIFTSFMNSITNPVNTGITTDGFMTGVHKDNFVKFEGRVLIDPVGVQDTQVATVLSNSSLSNGTMVSLVLQLVHSMSRRLVVCNTLRNGSLSTSSSDSDTINDVSLFGSVTKTASLVWACWTRNSVNCGKLSILPASDSEKESHHIRLLLSP